jgi:hypothetical protein
VFDDMEKFVENGVRQYRPDEREKIKDIVTHWLKDLVEGTK